MNTGEELQTTWRVVDDLSFILLPHQHSHTGSYYWNKTMYPTCFGQTVIISLVVSSLVVFCVSFWIRWSTDRLIVRREYLYINISFRFKKMGRSEVCDCESLGSCTCILHVEFRVECAIPLHWGLCKYEPTMSEHMGSTKIKTFWFPEIEFYLWLNSVSLVVIWWPKYALFTTKLTVYFYKQQQIYCIRYTPFWTIYERNLT